MANFLIFDLINYIALGFVALIFVWGITYAAWQFPRLMVAVLFAIAVVLSFLSPASPF